MHRSEEEDYKYVNAVQLVMVLNGIGREVGISISSLLVRVVVLDGEVLDAAVAVATVIILI